MIQPVNIPEDQMGAFKRAIEPFKQYINSNLRGNRRRSFRRIMPSKAERDYNTTDRRQAMAEGRRKVEESPLAMGIVKVQANNIVGNGFRLSMKTKDKGYNKEMESYWLWKRDTIDIRGVRRWGANQEMWFSRAFVDGDIGLKFVNGRDGARKIQAIEADRIYKEFGGGTSHINDVGITFDDKTGEPLTYWVGPRIKDQFDYKNEVAKGSPVDAAKFVLYLRDQTQRAERERGFSGFANNFNLFTDLQECMASMVQKVKNHATQTMAIKTNPSPGDASVFGDSLTEVKDDDKGVSRKHVRLDDGMAVELEEGEDIALLESNSPNSEFVPFLKYLMRFMSTSWGLPLELMLMDFSETNYSGGRALMGIAQKGFMVEQANLGFVSSKVFEWIAGDDDAPKPPRGLVGSPFAHSWGYPVAPFLDPKNEYEAIGTAVANGHMLDEQAIAQISGMDFEEFVEKRGNEIKAKQAAGIPIPTGLPGAKVIGGEDAEPEPGKGNEDVDEEDENDDES